MSVSITYPHYAYPSPFSPLKRVPTSGNVSSAMVHCSGLLMRLIINMATICLCHEQWAGCEGNLHALPCQHEDQSAASSGFVSESGSQVPWP